MHTQRWGISAQAIGFCHSSRIHWLDTHSGHLRRLREPVSRSKSGVQGKIAHVFHGRSRHAESHNEFKGYRILLATGRTDDWQEQPFRLEYRHNGARHCYTPDLLVVWGTHQEVVEIKEDAEVASPENQKRFALLRQLLAEQGYQFLVWQRSEICAEPRLTNVGLLLRYRCVAVTPTEHENIRRAFSSAPVLPLRTFASADGLAVQSVLRMVLDGVLHVNWWEPLRTPPNSMRWCPRCMDTVSDHCSRSPLFSRGLLVFRCHGQKQLTAFKNVRLGLALLANPGSQLRTEANSAELTTEFARCSNQNPGPAGYGGSSGGRSGSLVGCD